MATQPTNMNVNANRPEIGTCMRCAQAALTPDAARCPVCGCDEPCMPLAAGLMMLLHEGNFHQALRLARTALQLGPVEALATLAVVGGGTDRALGRGSGLQLSQHLLRAECDQAIELLARETYWPKEDAEVVVGLMSRIMLPLNEELLE